MAYESIDVNSLKTAIQTCRNSINYSSSKNLTSEIGNNSIWICNAKYNLKKYLERLTNEYYKELESTLQTCSTIVNYIEEYKAKMQENIQLQNSYNQLNQKLYYEEKYEESWFNHDINQWEHKTKTRTVKDTNVERKMNDTLQNIENNKSRINDLQNYINNAM